MGWVSLLRYQQTKETVLASKFGNYLTPVRMWTRVTEKFHSSTGDCLGDLCHWSQNPRLPCPRSKLLRAREWHLGLRWASDDLTSLLKAARGPPSMCSQLGASYTVSV